MIFNRIFLFVFFCLLSFQYSSLSAHDSSEKNTTVIHINEYGFDPSKIQVELGTQVIFENSGKEKHWPASDDHPSHTLYDGTNLKSHCAKDANQSLDSCRGLLPNESWSFVFKKEGTFELHDHLWLQLTGEVIVKKSDLVVSKNTLTSVFSKKIQELFSMVISIFRTKEKTLENNTQNIELENRNIDIKFYKQLKKKFQDIVNNSNPQEAIRVLQEESLKNDDVSAVCHDLLHTIGRTAYDKYGGIKESFKFQNDFCNSGYIHGLFEIYFKSAVNPLVDLPSLCNYKDKRMSQFDVWQCYHGIGHGIMYFTDGDLDKSLKLCSDSLDAKNSITCQNGAYMEVFNSEFLAKEELFVKSSNPFLTCSERDISVNDCYLYTPTYFSEVLNMNFIDISKKCASLSKNEELICINGVGAEAMKRNMNKTDPVFSMCQKMGSIEKQNTCVTGAVSMFMNQHGSNYESATKVLCKSSPRVFQDICYNVMSSRGNFFKN